jgi:hypothetical protein
MLFNRVARCCRPSAGLAGTEARKTTEAMLLPARYGRVILR